jgi:hypothetical protein
MDQTVLAEETCSLGDFAAKCCGDVATHELDGLERALLQVA